MHGAYIESLQDSGGPVPYKDVEQHLRVDKDCIDAKDMVVKSMEFARVAEYPVPGYGLPGEGGLENLLKKEEQESGRPEDGSDGINSSYGKISSGGKPEVVQRR